MGAVAATGVFWLVRGLMSAAPGSPFLSTMTVAGRIRPCPRYLLRSLSAQVRPAVSKRTRRTWFAVHVG
ncbi:hypothetical protein QR77_30735 [Streptomyces sp. 150FB]|nr:hypothetical protein QR77_30735 [Streptomyces sp. 150FB]